MRYDTDDNSRHMGLILLSPKNSGIKQIIKSVKYLPAKREETVQIQGLIVRLLKPLNIGFIYCRTTPSQPEVKAITKQFKECDILLGDFNLTRKLSSDLKKLEMLCESDKYLALDEITRRASNNQPDHIIIKKIFEKFCYVTSYHNFISDHKSIVFRLGDLGNNFSKDTLVKINFDSEAHLHNIPTKSQTKKEQRV